MRAFVLLQLFCSAAPLAAGRSLREVSAKDAGIVLDAQMQAGQMEVASVGRASVKAPCRALGLEALKKQIDMLVPRVSAGGRKAR